MPAAGGRWRGALAVAALLGAVPAAAERASGQEPIRLRYQAPASCPGRGDFAAALRDRAPSARLIDEGATRIFTVEISAVHDGYLGTLTVAGPGPTTARQLQASTCDQLVAALVLIIELGLDPAVGPRLQPEAVRVTGARKLTDGRARWTFGVAAGGDLALGIAPGAMARGELAGRISRGPGHVDLGIVVGRDDEARAEGEARFTLMAGRVAGCAGSTRRPIGFAACLVVEMGGLRARGIDIVNARASTRPWLATGGSIGAVMPVGKRVHAELQLGVLVPWYRDHFYFDPNDVIHVTEIAIPYISIGLASDLTDQD